MHRGLVATVLFGLLLAAAPCAATAAPSRAGSAGCGLINENQTRSLVGQLTEDRYSETYSGGGQPQTSNHRVTQFSMGSLTIRATTCRTNGRWRVLDPVVLTPSYANVSSDGTVPFGATGWGLAPIRVRDRSLVMRSVWCKTSRVWGGVKGLLGIPLPGSFTIAVRQYVAAQAGVRFLPDDSTRCRKIIKAVVPFGFGPRGELSLGTVGAQRTYLVSDLGDLKIKKDWRVTAQQG